MNVLWTFGLGRIYESFLETLKWSCIEFNTSFSWKRSVDKNWFIKKIAFFLFNFGNSMHVRMAKKLNF